MHKNREMPRGKEGQRLNGSPLCRLSRETSMNRAVLASSTVAPTSDGVWPVFLHFLSMDGSWEFLSYLSLQQPLPFHLDGYQFLPPQHLQRRKAFSLGTVQPPIVFLGLWQLLSPCLFPAIHGRSHWHCHLTCLSGKPTLFLFTTEPSHTVPPFSSSNVLKDSSLVHIA